MRCNRPPARAAGGPDVRRGLSVAAPAARLAAMLLALAPVADRTAHAQDLFEPPAQAPVIQAIRITGTVEVDARADEAFWADAEPIREFVQLDPRQGAPGTYGTEVRLVFDESALYVLAVCRQPRSEIRVQNLERDFSFDDNDLFGLAIDGFLDQRNAVGFQVTPYGNQRDLEVLDGTGFNPDWNARWRVATRIEDDQWVAEFAIPWSILRYPDDTDRLGIIFARNIRGLNELVSWPPVPRSLTVYRMAYGAELVHLDPPRPSRNLQVNPYLVSTFQDSDLNGSTSDFEVGGEIKWALTPNTVLDITVNTDFAQAEVDRQSINLNRFSVFFPERRQFFLENANIFSPQVTNWIRPFFSRRIGLDDVGRPIPIDGGVRLTNRSPRHELGVLAMRQQALGFSPESWFGVARYSHNIAGQSRLGGMFTWRENEALTLGDQTIPGNRNLTYTVDGLWRPNQEFGVQAMVSASQDDLAGDGLGAQLWGFFENNWIYIGLLEYFNKDYNPAIGLEILDTNYVMHSPAVYFDLRGDWLPSGIRSFEPGITAYYFESSDDGDLLFAYMPIRPLRLVFENGGSLGAVIEPNRQQLDTPFFPVGIEIAPGRYDYTRYRLDFTSDQSATLGGSVGVEWGDYFDGELTTYSISARYAPVPQVELTADYEYNQLRQLGVAGVDEDTRLYSVGARLALNPQVRFSTFYQRNSVSEAASWNARFAWEYQPLSYFYLVYNRDESDVPGALPGTTGSEVIAKLTYLFSL